MVSSPQPGHGRARLVALPSPTLAQADDATLTRAASAGDPRAVSVLWDRFSPMVRRVLRRTLGPRADVAPLVQRVFVRAIDELGTLPESAPLRPLMLASTARISKSELKRRGLRRLFPLPRSSPSGTDSEPSAGSPLAVLYELLDGLDVDARVAFTLRHFEGLQVAEVASVTHASLAATKRRLARSTAYVQAAGSPSVSEAEAIVRDHVSGHVDGDRHERGKQLLLAALRDRRRAAAPMRPRWLMALGLAAVLTAGATTAWRLHPERALSFQVSGGLVSDSGYVRSTSASGARLTFSDGARVELQEGSRARVLLSEGPGARIAIENGHAALDVPDSSPSEWFVDAGPFVLRVTGTRFDIDWSSYDDTLGIDLREGTLTVSGPPAPAGVMLRAGQRLTAREGRLSIEALDTARTNASQLASPAALPEDAALFLDPARPTSPPTESASIDEARRPAD